jgi:hypothetical protein
VSLSSQLREIYDRHSHELQYYPWMFETDRFAELIFCLLNECIEQDANFTRTAVVNLQNLGFLDVSKLESLDKPNNNTAVVSYVLEQHGFKKQNIDRALILLSRTAKLLQKEYNGKVQQLLRRYGKELRNSLVKEFASEILDEKNYVMLLRFGCKMFCHYRYR